MNSKLCIIVLFAFCRTYVEAGRNLAELRGPDYPPELLVNMVKSALDHCHKQIDIDKDLIVRFRDDEDFEGTPELGCYMLCIFREKGFWIENRSEANISKILEIVPPQFELIALNMGKKCMKVKGQDNCSRSLWYHNCWKKNDPVHYYLE